jgi:hypothetical protein
MLLIASFNSSRLHPLKQWMLTEDFALMRTERAPG